jgi:hypothetical protein
MYQRTDDRGQRPFCSLSSALRPLLRRPGGYGEGINTRSHPELGRENPQRQWYCVLRRGRVGRRQVFPTEATPKPVPQSLSTGRTTEDGKPRATPRPSPPPAGHSPPTFAGWSSPVARQAHNLKVAGSNPAPATILICSASPAVERSPGFLPFACPSTPASL